MVCIGQALPNHQTCKESAIESSALVYNLASLSCHIMMCDVCNTCIDVSLLLEQVPTTFSMPGFVPAALCLEFIYNIYMKNNYKLQETTTQHNVNRTFSLEHKCSKK